MGVGQVGQCAKPSASATNLGVVVFNTTAVDTGAGDTVIHSVCVASFVLLLLLLFRSVLEEQ